MAILTGSANCIRYVLFAFNFCFVITGIIIISVGAAVASSYDEYDIFLSSKFFSIPTFLIVIGSFIFIIAFFGCCGAYRENYCMILTFSVLLGLIFIFELSAGIAGYVLRNDARDEIKIQLANTMPNYNKDHPNVEKMWDILQTNFVCCGADAYKDWIGKLPNSTVDNPMLPMSCCSIPNGAVGNVTCMGEVHNKRLHAGGCLDAFAEYIRSHAVSLGATGIIFAIIQFAGIFFACYVARELKVKNGISGIF